MTDFAKEKWAARGRKIYCAKNGDIGDTVLLAEISNENIQEAAAIANFISFAPEMYRLLIQLAFHPDNTITYAEMVREAIKLYDLINGYSTLIDIIRKDAQ